MKNKHQKCVCFGQQVTKNLEPQIQKICLIDILIAILFFAHIKANVATILNFFIQIYSSVMFISGPLSYHK